MTIDTNELRRLAQAATPGPWYVTGKLTRYVEARIDGGLIQEVAACGPTKADDGYGPQQEANARLIAAANPAAISELIDRLEEAEKELAELRSSMKFRTSLIGRTEAERDTLRAKIAEMEKQEPVAEWLPLDSGEDTRRD
jgi:septal ring factor EnvC (AmiA/AmiB activator)